MQTVRVLTVVLVAAVIILSCGEKLDQQLTDAPFYTTYAEGLKAATADKPILVEFYTHW